MIAIGTVKRHINNIYGKLEVQSRTQAIAKARSMHLLNASRCGEAMAACGAMWAMISVAQQRLALRRQRPAMSAIYTATHSPTTVRLERRVDHCLGLQSIVEVGLDGAVLDNRVDK